MVSLSFFIYAEPTFAQDIIEVGGQGDTCVEDPECINRIHSDIPMVARVKQGQTILFHTRDAADYLGTIAKQTDVKSEAGKDWNFGRVH